MSESKHTSGPFKVEYKPRMRITGNTLVVVNDDRIPLAFVPAWDAPEPGEQEGAEEARANARLIAAAPELLEALKDIVCAFGMNNAEPNELFDALSRQMDRASAAIAKAEGHQ